MGRKPAPKTYPVKRRWVSLQYLGRLENLAEKVEEVLDSSWSTDENSFNPSTYEVDGDKLIILRNAFTDLIQENKL